MIEDSSMLQQTYFTSLQQLVTLCFFWLFIFGPYLQAENAPSQWVELYWRVLRLNLSLLSSFCHAHLLNFNFGQAARRKLAPSVMPPFYSSFCLPAGSDIRAKQPLGDQCYAPWMCFFAPCASCELNGCWPGWSPLQTLGLSVGVSLVDVSQWNTSSWTEGSGWVCVTILDFFVPVAATASARSSLVLPRGRVNFSSAIHPQAHGHSLRIFSAKHLYH